MEIRFHQINGEIPNTFIRALQAQWQERLNGWLSLRLVVAAEGDDVADGEVGGRGGVGVVAGEPDETVGIGKHDPFAAFHVVEIAAVEGAEGLAVGGELKPRHAADAGGGEVGGLRVEEDVAVNGGDFDDASGEAAGVGVCGDLRGRRRGSDGGVEKLRAVGGAGERGAAAVEPGVEGAKGDEAFGLVDIDVTVARDAEEGGTKFGGVGGCSGAEFRGRVIFRAVEFALVGEKEERDFRLEREAEIDGGIADLEGGADRDGTGVEARFLGGALGDERDNEAAHRFAFEQHAIGRAEFFREVGAERIEVGDGIGDDDAVATVAGCSDDPAFAEQGFVGEVLGEKIGDERALGVAEAVREEQQLTVPMRGEGDGEFRAGDLALFDLGGGEEGNQRSEK